jgi:hypothetical protein
VWTGQGCVCGSCAASSRGAGRTDDKRKSGRRCGVVQGREQEARRTSASAGQTRGEMRCWTEEDEKKRDACSPLLLRRLRPDGPYQAAMAERSARLPHWLPSSYRSRSHRRSNLIASRLLANGWEQLIVYVHISQGKRPILSARVTSAQHPRSIWHLVLEKLRPLHHRD